MGHGLKLITFYVQKHTAALEMCHNQSIVRDKPLGAPESVKLVYCIKRFSTMKSSHRMLNVYHTVLSHFVLFWFVNCCSGFVWFIIHFHGRIIRHWSSCMVACRNASEVTLKDMESSASICPHQATTEHEPWSIILFIRHWSVSVGVLGNVFLTLKLMATPTKFIKMTS